MGKGDIARTLANAPLQAPNDEMAAALAKAGEAATRIVNGVETVDTDKRGDTKVILPVPSFELVGNPKSYEDRTDKSKSNTRIAYVNMPTGSFTLQGSIYLETKVTQREDGRHEEKAIRFSLPKGVSMAKDVDSTKVDAWKDHVIDLYLAWRKESGGPVAGTAVRAGFRTI